jgi:hypothetical protein
VEIGTAVITTRRSTWLPRLSLWATGLVTMASAFIKEAWPAYKIYFEEPIPGFKHAVYNRAQTIEPYGPLLKVLATATTLLIGLAVVSYLVTRKRVTYGGARVDGETLVLVYSDKPERRIAIADIVSVVDTHAGAELELENGTRIELATQGREALKAELEKRRVKLDQLRAPRGRLELPMRGALTSYGPAVAWFFMLGGWREAGQMLYSGRYFNVALFGLFTAAWLGVGAWHWFPTRIAIGADGVRLSGRGRARFISFAEVRDIEASSSKLSLRLTDGSAVVVGRQEANLNARLRAALAAYRVPPIGSAGPEEHAHVLRRGERSSEEWRVQLKRLAHNQDYRADVLDEEALANVVGDARADPEQRVAAALALPKSDEARARIRVAARSSADEDVQRALEAAADDELAEAELARAMKRRV